MASLCVMNRMKVSHACCQGPRKRGARTLSRGQVFGAAVDDIWYEASSETSLVLDIL